MDESTGQDAGTTAPAKGGWFVTGIFLLALGSLGPGNVYLALTDPTYFDKFSGWRILILPFGTWLLTGFLVQGLTAIWVGGVKHDPDWSIATDRAWNGWCRLGWWLLAIVVGLIVAAYLFSGVATFLSTLDKGTALIGGLLFMILLALLRIGDQMKRR